VKYLIHGKDFHAPERYSAIQFINSPTQFANDFIRDCVARKNASDHARDNMYHFVLSLTEIDKANDAELFDAARMALKELGLSEHSAALVIHRDTDLPHVHIACDLVNPETFQRVKRPSHDFARLAKVCRLVESKNGWKKAKGHFSGDRAAARELGQPEPQPPERAGRSKKVRDADAHNPGPSFQAGIEGNEALKALFRDSLSWDDLSSRLIEYGQSEFGSPIQYIKHGSGAVLQLAEFPDARGKASLVHHSASLSKLEARFGTLIANPAPKAPSQGGSTQKEKTSKKDDLWKLYENLKADHQSDKADAKARRDALRSRQKAEMDALRKAQAADRRTLLKSILDHQTRLKLDSARALKAAQSRELLEQKHSAKRKALSSASRFPSWREWLQKEAESNPKAVERLKRLKEPEKKPETASLMQSIQIHHSDDGSIEYQRDNQTISIDKGSELKLIKNDDASILANLRIAQAKFGSSFEISIKNKEKYYQYIDVAARNGIYINTLSKSDQERWKQTREAEFAKYRTKIPNPDIKKDNENHHRRNLNATQSVKPKENTNVRTPEPVAKPDLQTMRVLKNRDRSR
jgi:hypothetical protein